MTSFLGLSFEAKHLGVVGMTFSQELSAKLQELVGSQRLDDAKNIFYDFVDDLDRGIDCYHAAFVLTYGSEPDFEKAEFLYDKAIDAGEGKFWIYYHRGNMYLRIGRWQEAVHDFVKAYGEDPHSLVRNMLIETLRSAAANADPTVFPAVFQAAMPVLAHLWEEGGVAVPHVREPAAFTASLSVLDEPPPVLDEHAWAKNIQSEVEINKAFEDSVGHFQPLAVSRQIFVNSVPKSGTHLLRNLLAHFFGHSNLDYFLTVDTLAGARPLAAHGHGLMFGHLPFGGDSLFSIRGIPQILLMRHPAENLLALARAAYDPRNDRPDYVFARRFLTIQEYMTALIRGYEIEGVRVDPFDRFMNEFLLGWSGQTSLLVDYSEVMTVISKPDSVEGMEILSTILERCGSGLPPDWRERVNAAGNRDISSTYLPPLADDVRKAAIDHAYGLVTGFAPGILAWYERMRARRLEER